MPQSLIRLMQTYNSLPSEDASHTLHGMRAFVGKDPKTGFYDYADLEKRILEDMAHLKDNETREKFLLEVRVFIEKFEKQESLNKEDKKILYAARAAFFALAQKLNYSLRTALEKTSGYKSAGEPKPFGLFALGTHEYINPQHRDPIQHTMIKQFYDVCTSPKGIVDGPTDLYRGRDCIKRSHEALDAFRKACMENPHINRTVGASNSRGFEVNQRLFQRVHLDSTHGNSLLPDRVEFSLTHDPVAGWGRKSGIRNIPPNVEYTLATEAIHEGRWTHSEQSTATGRGILAGLRHLFKSFTSDKGTRAPVQSGAIMPFSGEHNHLSHGFASQGASSYVNAPLIINYCLTYDALTKNGLTFSQIPDVVDRKSGAVIINLQKLEDTHERYLEVLNQFEIMRASEEEYKKHARGEAFIYSQRTVAKIKDEFIDHPDVFLNNYHEFAFSRQYSLLHNYVFNKGAANPFSHDDKVKKGFVKEGGYSLGQVLAEAEKLRNENPGLYECLVNAKYISEKHHESITLKEKQKPEGGKWRLVPVTTSKITLTLPPKPTGSSKVRDLLLPKPETDFEKYMVFAKHELKKTWFETGRPKRYVESSAPEVLLKAPVVSVRDVFAMIDAIDKQDMDEKKQDSTMTLSLVNLVRIHSDLNYKLRESIFEILFVRLAQFQDPLIKDAAVTLRDFWNTFDRRHKKSEHFVLYLVEQLFNPQLKPSAITTELEKMRDECYIWQGDSKALFDVLAKRFAKLRHKPEQAESHHHGKSHASLFQPAESEVKSPTATEAHQKTRHRKTSSH